MPEATRRDSRQKRQKRPLLKSPRFWVPISILLLLIVLAAAGGLAAKALADRAFAARDALQAAIPLASTAKKQILDSDTEGAKKTVAELAQLSEEAREQADGGLWRFGEIVPVVGGNLSAVRTVAAAVDELVDGALVPASQLSLSSLAPKDGRIDVSQLGNASRIVDQAAAAVTDARSSLDEVNRDGLIEQVSAGVAQLDDALAGIEPLIEPAQQTLAVLPGILGADAPRNYLVLVQNNAESRGTGGNPASLVLITADDGAISITGQASSSDFDNGRPAPVIDLDPATKELYGDKVGRYMQDVTTTPDFAESSRIMRAFWAEEFESPVDATVSIDPVALSYLMKATGPVDMPNGDVLTADNVVSTLLNEVYFRYPDPAVQDAYFAAAAGAVFDSITSVSNPRALVDEVVRAVDEGRIMYVPATEEEAEVIGDSRLTGELPASNEDRTVIGSYVNDVTEGKLDFYMDTAVTVTSDVCS
ncbi:MAG: DUF4012 domain-containing protein, partial [Xanthomonas perforans]|nr:DUF4012 domain-containing protein [Xanthomonas perforans]